MKDTKIKTNIEKLRKATNLLIQEKYTLVLYSDNDVFTSFKRGIRPLLEAYDSNKDYSSYVASDKVIGKGAAFLYILLQIKTIQTNVISRPALELLKKYNIMIKYNILVDNIFNHTKTDLCPMEKLTLVIDDPNIALEKMRIKLKELKD